VVGHDTDTKGARDFTLELALASHLLSLMQFDANLLGGMPFLAHVSLLPSQQNVAKTNYKNSGLIRRAQLSQTTSSTTELFDAVKPATCPKRSIPQAGVIKQKNYNVFLSDSRMQFGKS
jgi:hypothetical protein